jgi:hypothetical protein
VAQDVFEVGGGENHISGFSSAITPLERVSA